MGLHWSYMYAQTLLTTSFKNCLYTHVHKYIICMYVHVYTHLENSYGHWYLVESVSLTK